jgi:hypothetical protein
MASKKIVIFRYCNRKDMRLILRRKIKNYALTYANNEGLYT